MAQKTALVVDDSSTARLLLSKVLRNIGIICREAVSGKGAHRLGAVAWLELSQIETIIDLLERRT